MSMHGWKHRWASSIRLHRIDTCDDLNFYYKKFLAKLSRLCLKIFLPILFFVHLLSLLLCRAFFGNATRLTWDRRTNVCLITSLLTLISLLFVRLHKKWQKLWLFTRCLLIVLLIIPLVVTHQTSQFHVLFSTVSILLVYALLTFTLLQSFLISMTISISYLLLLLFNQQTRPTWNAVEVFSLVLYHCIIHITGLSSYVGTMKHIREHFYAYQANLHDKNKANVDCKKLHTIMGYCQQSANAVQSISYRNSRPKSVLDQSGTVIHCVLSLNEQTCVHTCDELASFIDILFCQIEQLILTHQPHARYTFDNETITIILIDNDEHREHENVNRGCHLAIELFRFIQHVNNITRWCLTSVIGIDSNALNVLSADYIQGPAYDYPRWLCDQCLIKNRIHISARIYRVLREDPSYEFQNYLLVAHHMTYFLFHVHMYEPLDHSCLARNTSDMIDQLTRIQTEAHVEKHLGTLTLTRSLRKRSLFDLTSKSISWFTLHFKDSLLTNDFRANHRTQQPTAFFYFFLVLLLVGSLVQSLIFPRMPMDFILAFPVVILSLLAFIRLFYCSMKIDDGQVKSVDNRKFLFYFNILICLTFSTLFFVALQYHSIEIYKYFFLTSPRINATGAIRSNHSVASQINANLSKTSLPFDRQYHDYLVLSPLYALYCCISYRQCSWQIKTCFIVICTLVQLCSLEYIWLTTNISLSSIDSLHHYNASALILLHNVLLILGTYVREWLEKIDFIWLREIDIERVKSLRQRHELIQQTSLVLPMRLIAYYLNSSSDATLTQHYHVKYDRMALLSIRFRVFPHEHEYVVVDFLHHLDYVLKTNERYVNIVMHRKSTVNEILFSIDMEHSAEAIQQLVELLFLVDERLKQRFQSQIDLTACLHIGSVHEILVHFEQSPKIDLWSEHITFMQLLMSNVQANHCLVTASVYQLLNDLYLFRTAGSIQRTQMSIDNHTTIYYLLGRLIGENTFEGRNALPLAINDPNISPVRKSPSTDDSQHPSQTDKYPIQTSSATTTSSSGMFNDQQRLLKQAARRSLQPSTQSSYRHTLLHAVHPGTTTATIASDHSSALKKLSTMTHSNDTSIDSSREAANGDKCLILTQTMLNGTAEMNNCRASTSSLSNRQLSAERKSFTQDDFRQLIHENSGAKAANHPSHQSLSTTNEETSSSFSGWDVPSSATTPADTEPQPTTSYSPVIVSPDDGYYPARPCELSFTVNMSTTEDGTDTKSTIINSPISLVDSITAPSAQQSMVQYRPAPYNLARQLIADTSESELSIPPQRESWTNNVFYRSKNRQRSRLSSSYNNLHDSSKSIPRHAQSIRQTDLLQRWLEDQLHLFRLQIQQLSPLSSKKSDRLSTDDDDGGEESETMCENTFPILASKSNAHSASIRRPFHHRRYKPLGKTLTSGLHLIRHESLKHRSRPLLNEQTPRRKLSRRTNSSSMPRSDLSEQSLTRPDNRSESALSNLESEYDNMHTHALSTRKMAAPLCHSQILTDEEDETTSASKRSHCYF